jgi:dGTPase
VILAATGLAHDLGNPPFGHQGEQVISGWFSNNAVLFSEYKAAGDGSGFTEVPTEFHRDFTEFEGNAQTLRLVTCLQNTAGPSGLNLTAATLAALMKYPIASSVKRGKTAATKKYGYFRSEDETVTWIRNCTGLKEAQRHPLTWLMEASDDIAYSVMDVEDSIKKGLVSAEDLLAYLRRDFAKTDLGGLINTLEEDFAKVDEAETSLSRVREVKTTYVRTRLIERLVTGAAAEFRRDAAAINSFEREAALLECDTHESKLNKALKYFALNHAYRSTSVQRVELQGFHVLEYLMGVMWNAIANRAKFADLDSRRPHARDAFVYSLISDNYRWQFEKSADSKLPIRYRELQLLSDMISGMTDGFAVDLQKQIAKADRA